MLFQRRSNAACASVRPLAMMGSALVHSAILLTADIADGSTTYMETESNRFPCIMLGVAGEIPFRLIKRYQAKMDRFDPALAVRSHRRKLRQNAPL